MSQIGTSGWSYKEWIGALYPKGTRAGDFLKVYAQNFTTVEINNTFYRMPRADMLKRWDEITPSGFLFAIKMWRAIVHANEPDPGHIADFFNGIAPLGDKIGPILFQLPPKKPVNVPWLETLLAALPGNYRYVFELRDPSWLCDPVYDVLRKNNVTNCFYDYRAFRNPEIVTSDLLYLRLHGPQKQPWRGRYSRQDMDHYTSLMRAHPNAFCYFDNTMDGAAVLDARDMLARLDPAAKKHAA